MAEPRVFEYLDDNEPVTDSWLREIGFVRLMQPAADNHLSLGHPASERFINARQGHREKFRTWHVGGDVLPMALQPKTRGDVRLLLAALKVALTIKV